jgi:hypothetical protein
LYKHESWKREWDLEALRDAGIVVLDPADKTDTYALVAASTCVITCGSTVGLECAYLGKPCAEVGPRVAGLIGATASIISEADVQRFIANPNIPDGAREQALRYGSYARAGGEPLPELDPGTHPDYSRIDGRVVDPVRFMARRVRSRFGREPYIPLPPGGKIVLDPTIAKAMSK